VSETTRRRLGFLALDALFLVIIGAVTVWTKQLPTIDLRLLPFFALATFRLARTLSFNEIAEPLRAPFTEVMADSCGAGSDVHPRGGGIQYVIGSLLACPICTGTWSALALFTAYTVYAPFGKTLVYVLAFAGASEVLHWAGCLLEWGGRAARVYSGKTAPDKE
jgi:hypothetical protein